jgi:hypothetical protein
MRTGLLVPGLAVCAVACLAWLTPVCERMTTAALSEEARVAIDVRCQGRQDRSARECRRLLTKLYLSGSLDPDRTLRTWCEQVENSVWGGSRPAPPALCVERYGGWQRG